MLGFSSEPNANVLFVGLVVGIVMDLCWPYPLNTVRLGVGKKDY